MLDYAEPLAKIESIRYPVGMEIAVEVGGKRGYERKMHKVVEEHKHFVVMDAGNYKYCLSKTDLYYLPTIRVEEYGKL